MPSTQASPRVGEVHRRRRCRRCARTTTCTFMRTVRGVLWTTPGTTEMWLCRHCSIYLLAMNSLVEAEFA